MAKKEITYKEEITYFLNCILAIASYETNQGEDYEKRYAERLNFQSETEWKKYKASVDLLEDTENAITSAFEYQLGDLGNKNRDFNGMYLRLYGILNAVYLQMSAFEELADLLRYSLEKKEVRKLFRQLDIYKLRNIVGAHTLNFSSAKEFLDNVKETSFRIIAADIEETGSNIAVISQHGKLVRYNLLKVLHEYEQMARDLLIQMVRHAINKLVSNKKQKIDLTKELDKKLKKLIDYTKIDKNKVHTEKAIKEQKMLYKKMSKKLAKINYLEMLKMPELVD